MFRSRALLYLRTPDLHAALDAIETALGRDRFVSRSEPLPPGYRAGSSEVRELFVGPGGGEWVPVWPRDAARVFEWAKAVSEAAPQLPALAVYADEPGRWALKFYSGGTPLAKLGRDADSEVFYDVPIAGPSELSEAARAFGLDTPSTERLLRASARLEASPGGTSRPLGEALSLPCFGRAFHDIASLPDAGRDGFRWHCWVRRGSPLDDWS